MIPEKDAADRIAAAVGQHLTPRWFSDEGLQAICQKVVAHRGFVRSVFDSLDANPKRLPERDVVLRQDATSQLDSIEFWTEHAGHLAREYEDALRILERVRAGTMADYNPDERGADEDQDRWSREIADEKAERDAPRLGAAS